MPFDDSTARRLDDDDAPLTLLVVGDTTVQSIALPPRGAVVLGRARDCEVAIADASVSRRHARLHVSPLRLEDLGSANGTRVGTRRVVEGSAIDLASGDSFTVGSVTVFVQRARLRVSGLEVRTDGYFEARLAAECVRASKFALRFAVVTLAVGERTAGLQAAVRAEVRGVDVVSMAPGGEARVLLLHATRDMAESFANRACARIGAGECEVGIAACPEDGVEPGKLMVAMRAGARPRLAGAPPCDGVELIAESTAGLELKARASRLAQTAFPLLFVGEEGTGKRVLAAWVHAKSKLGRRPLVRIACDTMLEAQLEAAIFGEDGGDSCRAIEAADGGAMLLERIDALPAALEARLAHVLEYGQTYRVGSTTPRRVRVRVLATARRRVDREMLRRLASVVVEVPPLRGRRDDIAPLARAFTASACVATGRPPMELSAGAIDVLRKHPWPGNVRALRIAIERAVASTAGPRIDEAALDLSPAAREASALRDEVETLERERIAAALETHGGNKSRAARALGIARNTLLTRIRTYGIDRPR
jgi:ActR/RegA family two-component response regulator